MGRFLQSAPSLQSFEGGKVFIRDKPFAVSSATLEKISTLVNTLRDRQFPTKLGWPVSDERPIGPGDSDRIQFFQDGNVTLHNGKREIWLRPE